MKKLVKHHIHFVYNENDDSILSAPTKESQTFQVKFLLEEYDSDQERIREYLTGGKTLEDICLEMNVNTRQDLLYVISIVNHLKNENPR